VPCDSQALYAGFRNLIHRQVSRKGVVDNDLKIISLNILGTEDMGELEKEQQI
jgi:hypothetical protein